MNDKSRRAFLQKALPNLACGSFLAFGGDAVARPIALLAQSARSAEDAAMAALVGPSSGRPTRTVNRFTIDGGGGFVLDRGARPYVLLKVDSEREIWALRSNFGARGDEVLSNDAGQVMVRVNEFGGATYFRSGDTVGRAAAPADGGDPIGRLPSVRVSLQTIVESHLARFDAFAPGEVRLEAEGGLPPDMADEAFRVIYRALLRMPRIWHQGDSRRVRRFRLVAGARPSVIVQRRLLLVTLTPSMGYAGRPSSAAIAAALRGTD